MTTLVQIKKKKILVVSYLSLITACSQTVQLSSNSQSQIVRCSPLNCKSQVLVNTSKILHVFQAAAAFLSHPNPGKFSAPGVADFNSMSPRSSSSGVHSPLISQTVFANTNNELQRLRDELSTNKAKLQSWEEGINQARSVSI